MPTPGERRALIFLAAAAALGVTARGVVAMRGKNGTPELGDRAGLARQIVAVDSAIASGGAKRGRPSKSANDESAAPKTGSPKRTNRRAVPDSGTIAAPIYRDDGSAPPPKRDNREAYWRSRERVDSMREAINARSAAEAAPKTARVPSKAGPPPAARLQIDMDIATAPEIATLPYIGLALATRIVADRGARGAFGSLQELERVPGVGAAMAKKLQPYVTFSLPPRLGGAGESIRFRKKRRREPR